MRRRWEAHALSAAAGDIEASQREAEAAGDTGWSATLRIARSMLAGGSVARAPRVRATDDAAPAFAALGVRAGLLALDTTAIEAAAALGERAVGADGLLASLTAAWARLAIDGDGAAALTVAERAQREARDAGRGALVVDATALEALARLVSGATESGVARARTASRMAASEGIAPLTVIAHLVLARARRLAGHPHLGAHVAAAIGQHLGAGCQAWAGWEQALGAGHTSGAGAADVLGRTLEALAAADREALDDRRAELDVAPLPRFARIDADVLLELADHRAAPSHAPRWILGHEDAVPAGLDAALDASGASAFVLAAPGAPGRRVLSVGVPLAMAERSAQLVAPAEAHLRTDSAIAQLLLHGEQGVEASELFARLYGFALVERHRGVLRILLHRVRQRAEGLVLVRDGERLRLEVDGPMLFPDPRCARPDAGLLSLAARLGAVGPRDLAELGLPLRRAQESLRRLADAGILAAQPAGRGVAYVLEDTTFTSPTP